MKKIFIISFLFMLVSASLFGADTLFIKETQIPILLERHDNVLFRMRIEANNSEVLDNVVINFGDEVDMAKIKSVKLYYSGTCARQEDHLNIFAPVNYMPFEIPGKTLKANPSYSVLQQQIKNPTRSLTLNAHTKLFPGMNFFWISLEMKSKAPLSTKVTAKITEASIDGNKANISLVSPQNIVHRMGIGVCHAGDFGSNAFRIPGLVTTNKGTLVSVFDIRYNSSKDLQEHIEIGSRRSMDGGQHWSRLYIPLAFGEDEGLPSSQNGVGDPSILVDRSNNTIWVIAAWAHGMGNQMTWWSSYPGMDKHKTAQLVLSKSTDDGKTWSKPINITDQVKKPEWYFLLQGPGRGITMQDGTLVFPIQFIKEDREPAAGVMYSKDHGETWHIHNYARTNTTEAQVVEIEPGVLMLNMRDNRGGSRAVATTSDLGKTWKEHPSSRSALQESVCQASLIKVAAKDNISGKELLLFSNPNTTKGRHHITIKASLDKGLTWPEEYQIMLDEGDGWGYSCLSMIDAETVGILYESSTAEITFQAIKIKDLLKL